MVHQGIYRRVLRGATYVFPQCWRCWMSYARGRGFHSRSRLLYIVWTTLCFSLFINSCECISLELRLSNCLSYIQEIDHQYKCSAWSSRTMDPLQILQQFCQVTKQGEWHLWNPAKHLEIKLVVCDLPDYQKLIMWIRFFQSLNNIWEIFHPYQS
jgi:hypothetical protein